jgi:hypothetical protein
MRAVFQGTMTPCITKLSFRVAVLLSVSKALNLV